MSRFTLPKNWTIAKLKDLTAIVGGGTPSRDNPLYFGGDIPWVTPTDVTGLNDLWIDTTAESLTPQGLHNSSAVLLPAGAVLMTSRATIGVTAINHRPMCTNQGFASFICKDQVLLNEYLAYWLPAMKQRLIQLAGGTTFKEISKSTLAQVEIPLPPLSEQRRITAILQEANAIDKIRRQANEKAQEIIEAVFYDMFGGPTYWTKTLSLQQCVDFVGGGTPNTKVKEYFQGEIPWATSKDIKRRYLHDTQDHITEEAIQHSATKLVPANTILVVVKSKILMHSLPISITTRPVCFGQDLKGLVCKPGFEPQFIATSLALQKDRILGSARGVNTEGLTLELLRSIPIPHIPFDLQRSFVQKVRACDNLSLDYQEAKLYIDVIYQALLAQAFIGELTAAWRDTHATILAQEAHRRDELLRELHAAISTVATPPPVQQNVVEERRELAKELTGLQHALLALIHDSPERYFLVTGLHEEITAHLDEQGGYLPELDEEGLYRDFDGQDCSLDTLHRDLDYLAELGLIKKPTLRIENESGPAHFIISYRSLLADDDSQQQDLELLEELEQESMEEASV